MHISPIACGGKFANRPAANDWRPVTTPSTLSQRVGHSSRGSHRWADGQHNFSNNNLLVCGRKTWEFSLRVMLCSAWYFSLGIFPIMLRVWDGWFVRLIEEARSFGWGDNHTNKHHLWNTVFFFTPILKSYYYSLSDVHHTTLPRWTRKSTNARTKKKEKRNRTHHRICVNICVSIFIFSVHVECEPTKHNMQTMRAEDKKYTVCIFFGRTATNLLLLMHIFGGQQNKHMSTY